MLLDALEIAWQGNALGLQDALQDYQAWLMQYKKVSDLFRSLTFCLLMCCCILYGLEARTYAAKGDDVMDKSDHQEGKIDDCNDINYLDIHRREHDQENQANEQHSGANFAGHQCAFKHITSLKPVGSCDQLVNFLDDQKDQYAPKEGITDRKTKGHCKLGSLVGNRVKEFTYSRYHVEAASNLTVQHICNAGQRQNTGTKIVVTGRLRIKIHNNIDRDQDQPK